MSYNTAKTYKNSSVAVIINHNSNFSVILYKIK